MVFAAIPAALSDPTLCLKESCAKSLPRPFEGLSKHQRTRLRQVVAPQSHISRQMTAGSQGAPPVPAGSPHGSPEHREGAAEELDFEGNADFSTTVVIGKLTNQFESDFGIAQIRIKCFDLCLAATQIHMCQFTVSDPATPDL